MAGDGAGRRMKPSWIKPHDRAAKGVPAHSSSRRLAHPAGQRAPERPSRGSSQQVALDASLQPTNLDWRLPSHRQLKSSRQPRQDHRDRTARIDRTPDCYWSDRRLCVRRPLGGPVGMAAGSVLGGGFEVRNRLEALGRDRGPTAQEAPPRRRRGDSASPRSRGQHYFVLVGRPHALRAYGRRMARTPSYGEADPEHLAYLSSLSYWWLRQTSPM